MSRIFAPVDKFPLPDDECRIDVKLKDGSKLIGCFKYGKDAWWKDNVYIDRSDIVSWRYHKDDMSIDWPTESNFSFGSDK